MMNHPAHQHEGCPVCQGRVDMAARLSPAGLWAGLVVAAVVVFAVMPYGWVLHIARALATLGVIGLASGLVSCLIIAAIRATSTSRQHR